MHKFENSEGFHHGWEWFKRDGATDVLEPQVISDWEWSDTNAYPAGWTDNLVDAYLKSELPTDEDRAAYDELLVLASKSKSTLHIYERLKPLLDGVVLPRKVPADVRLKSR